MSFESPDLECLIVIVKSTASIHHHNLKMELGGLAIGTPCTGRPSRAQFMIKLSKHECIEVGKLFVMNNGRPQRVTPTMTPTKEKAPLSQ